MDRMMQSDMSGALAGFKVIDLSRVLSGPLCTQILGDHGAEVIKIEPPSGDETRAWGPFGAQGSAYDSGINRNKRHAAVDLSKKVGRELLLRLLDGADVLIHNFKAGTLERWDLGYDDVLSKRFPRLIYSHHWFRRERAPRGTTRVRLSGAGYRRVHERERSPGLRPDTCCMSIVDIGTAMNALAAILLAPFERERSGLGQKLQRVPLRLRAFLPPSSRSRILADRPRPVAQRQSASEHRPVRGIRDKIRSNVSGRWKRCSVLIGLYTFGMRVSGG
jgi:crotonobetainyl-CoA:carnitine CoA-transferase CaiB-like acyl-CoA transferase